MTDMQISELSVEQTLQALMDHLLIGMAHLGIGIGLQKADPVVLSTANLFFGFTIHAHMEAAQMHAARLFDKTSGSVTVESLLKRLKSRPVVLKNGAPEALRHVVAKAELKLQSLEKPLSAIKLRRNEWLAHTSPAPIIDPERLAHDAALTVPDIEMVFKVTAEILNSISNLVSGITTWADFADQNDYEYPLKLIADAKCAQVHEFEAEFGPAPFPRPRGCTSKAVKNI